MTASEKMSAQYSRPARKKNTFNLEKWGWIYMRVSGVFLIALIFGHLFVNLYLGDGIHAIDFGFVGGKLSQPFWQWWDLALLWLSLIHGGNGMRTIINDYANSVLVRKILTTAVFLSVSVLIILGTLVIFTFDPCPAGAPHDLLPKLCSMRNN